MTIFISESARSVLHEGIETVVIPVTSPHDLEQLVFHTQRGGQYDVVEWLLGELGRPTEIDRVCGLTMTPYTDRVVVNLQMRQPGKQVELWIVGKSPPDLTDSGGNLHFIGRGVICARALSQERFTDTHKPWWEPELAAMREVDTAEHRSEAHQG